METLNETTGLIKFEEVTSIMHGASEVMEKNQNLLAKAKDKAKTLLDTVEAEGMNDEIDAELNKWQVNAKIALEKMNERRTPITQMMTRIAKLYTGLENEIDPSKADSFYSKIQLKRNAYAKQKAEAARAKEQEILRAQAKEKEKINIQSEVERQIRASYQERLLLHKQAAQGKFNALTLENLTDTTAAIKAIKLNYPHDKFLEIPVNVTYVYHDKTEAAGIIFDVRENLFSELSINFRENMEDIQRNILELIPSRKRELEEIAKSSKEQAEELRRQAQLRQEQEAARLREEAEEAKQADAEAIKTNETIAVTGSLFDTQAQLAEAKENTGKSRQGYQVNIYSMSGWMAIAAFWFSKEGAKTDPLTAGKKSLDQMKAFCEKHAHKTNEKVIHADVVYEEEFKAIATKG